MPSTNLLCIIVLLATFLGDTAGEETAAKMSPELAAVKQRYETELEAATKPVRDRYAASLQSLLRATTQKGDLASAQAIQTELFGLTSKATLVGKWHFKCSAGNGEREFLKDGTGRSQDGSKWTWILHTDKVVLNYPDTHSDVLFLPINPTGTKGRSWVGPEIIATKRSQ